MCTKQQVKQITTLQMKKEEQKKKYIIHPSKTLLSWTNDSSVAIIRTGFKILLCKLALQVGQGPLQKWMVQFYLSKYLWVVTFNSISTVTVVTLRSPGAQMNRNIDMYFSMAFLLLCNKRNKNMVTFKQFFLELHHP